jgi:hypothetical protein
VKGSDLADEKSCVDQARYKASWNLTNSARNSQIAKKNDPAAWWDAHTSQTQRHVARTRAERTCLTLVIAT